MACERLRIDWTTTYYEWKTFTDISSSAEFRSNPSRPIMSTKWYLNHTAVYQGMSDCGRYHKSTITLQLRRENYGKKLQIKGVLYHENYSNMSFELDCIIDSDSKHVTVFVKDRKCLPCSTAKIICIAWITELTETDEKTVLTLPNFSKLLCDMHGMYEKQIHSDLIVNCKGVEIRVHKCVLSARSPVFAKMFEHVTTESSDNRIIITDIDPDILEELMKFLYCGKINSSMYSKIHDLYCAAEKYLITDLKDTCRDFITSSFASTTTAVEALNLADKNKDEEMMQKAAAFIVSSFQHVNST